jgi:tRNA modification GTPase
VAEDTYAPCLLYLMRVPHSYTREDVAEIHTIGNPILLEMLLEELLSRARKSHKALRLAEPGEFTRRAFLNGRIDLCQAEAVLRIIRSRSDAELRLAVRQLGGETSRLLKETQERLAELLCHLELSLDFSDQDIEPLPQETLKTRLEIICNELHHYQKEDTNIKRGGVRAVFYGPPNAGKSSLFNALLGRPRAITSPHPGTTRDTLEAELTLHGIPFCLVDTAGIESENSFSDRPEGLSLQGMAMSRSQKAMEASDLTLLVLDGCEPLKGTLESFYPAYPEDSLPTLLVINKSDLFGSGPCHPQRPLPENLPPHWHHLPLIYTSALTGRGLEDLREKMVEQVLSGGVDRTPSPINSRQRLLVAEGLEALERAMECMKQASTQELVALELREALDALGQVCGTITSAGILERIFSQFCIGK